MPGLEKDDPHSICQFLYIYFPNFTFKTGSCGSCTIERFTSYFYVLFISKLFMNLKCHCNITLQSSGLISPLQLHHSPFGIDSQQIPTGNVKITLDSVTAKLILTPLLQGLEAQTAAELESFSVHLYPELNFTILLPAQPYVRFQEEQTTPRAHLLSLCLVLRATPLSVPPVSCVVVADICINFLLIKMSTY